jgi:hypothetical protein
MSMHLISRHANVVGTMLNVHLSTNNGGPFSLPPPLRIGSFTTIRLRPIYNFP